MHNLSKFPWIALISDIIAFHLATRLNVYSVSFPNILGVNNASRR